MSIYNCLYDWQKKIIDNFKSKQSFGLFLDMGLGKTPLGLAMAEANRCTKVIIVTINAKAIESETVKGSWLNWATKSSVKYKFFDKRSTSFDGNSLVVINYESLFERGKNKTSRMTLKSSVETFINTCRGHNVAIIVDESHKMKNLQSQQTMALLKIKQKLIRVANNVYTYLLTGTPFTTGYIDLYSQLKMLGCEMTKGDFIDNFCKRGNIPGLLGWQQPIVGYKNIERLYKLIHDYAITIKSEDVVDLPDKVFVDHILEISEPYEMFTTERCQKSKIYDYGKRSATEQTYTTEFNLTDFLPIKDVKVNNPFYRDIDYDFSRIDPIGRWVADTTGTFWLRARQLSIGFQGNAETFKWFDEARLEAVKKFLKENEDNYLLFYNFTPELLRLYDICEELGYNIDVYCGEIKSMHFYERFSSLSEEEKLVNKKNIALVNFASGSTGLNLQEYNKCIIFSVPLYKDYEQGIKRINRLGQKHTTIYHMFHQSNWLDEAMLASLRTSTDYSVKMFESDLKRVQELTSETKNDQ